MDLDQVNIALSEGRQELNSTGLTAEKREALLKKQNDLEIKYRSLVKEKQTEKRDVPQELHTRAMLGNYVKQAALGSNLTGAEKELNDELRIEDGHFPISMLLPRNERVEERVDVATNVGNIGPSHQNSILQRVWHRSDLAFLGVMPVSVPTGESSYPVITAGATGTVAGEGDAVDAQAASLTTTRILPKRFSSRYLISIEDTANTVGLEDALRMDLRASLTDAVDRQVVAGDSTGNNFTGIINSRTNFFGTAPTTVATFEDFVNGILGPINPPLAYSENELSLLLHADTLRWLSASFSESQGGSSTLLSFIKDASIMYRTSSRMPGHTNANVASILITQHTEQNYAVAPMWNSISLIRDQYTQASTGRLALTASMLCGFSVIRNAHNGLRLKVAS